MEQASSNEELLGFAVIGMCCLLIAGGAFIAFLVWMLRTKKPPQPSTQQFMPPPPPSAPVEPAPTGFHLSVLALAFDGYFRPQVEALLQTPATATEPVGLRVELVQRAMKGLLGVEPQWRHFGYGEKDLPDAVSAQQSFSNAVADFRARAMRSSDGGALCVLTLVLATRDRRLGVDRLDTRQQARELVTDRARVDGTTLLGAEVIWAPSSGALTENAVRERYPEMHALL